MSAAASFLTTAANGSTLTTYTFSSQTLGTAVADRHIIAQVCGSVTGTDGIASVTIAGVSATLVKQELHTANTDDVNSIWIAAVPTGTTGDVVVVMNSLSGRCGIGLYKATGLGSATPHASASDSTSYGANPAPSTTIDCEAGGIIIAVSYIGNTPTTSGVSWAGVTEDYETVVEANAWESGASDEFGSIQTGLTITPSWTNGSGFAQASVIVASWSPTAAATSIKSLNGLAIASVKSRNGLAIASIKSINGLSNVS